MDPISLIIPAFAAGLLTFLAPCTLPLVPAFLGFIGGAAAENGEADHSSVRRRVLANGLMYVIGFTFVFVLLGSAFGLGGQVIAKHRAMLARIGGVFVILFGLYMMNVLRFRFLSFLQKEKRVSPLRFAKPGSPVSSFLFGATFALGWSPCIGPILGSILLLASVSATATQGALLLLVFSAGLGLPFMLIALGFGHAADYVRAISRHLNKISVVGGAFLVFLGILMVTGRMDVWLSWTFRMFDFAGYIKLTHYL